MSDYVDLKRLLKLADERDPSDIFLKVGSTPFLKIKGKILSSGLPKLSKNNILLLLQEIELASPPALQLVKEKRRAYREQHAELDIVYRISPKEEQDYPNLSCLRINAFWQLGNPGMVIRTVGRSKPNLDRLSLPPKLKKLLKRVSCAHSGLILVVGTTGSGKSSTLAAMINHLSSQPDSCHILTIEDPVERVYEDKIKGGLVKSLFTLREEGVDTPDMKSALKGALRQAPKAILIGEIRDSESMKIALEAAQTGHLVFSTLHTIGAVETINRILSLLNEEPAESIVKQLAEVLKCIVSQKLISRAYTESEKLAVVEVLVNNSKIQEILSSGNWDKDQMKNVVEIMEKDTEGMQTMQEHLNELVKLDLVDKQVAMQCGYKELPHPQPQFIKKESGKNYLPVIVDSIKKIDDFEMTRCTYFKIECDTPAPGWVLELQDKSIPIYLLEFSAIIWKPIGGDDIFGSPKMIDDLFDLIEGNPEVFVDVDEIWLPNFLFNNSDNEKNPHSRGCVYRIHQDLFIEAYKFNANRISEKLFFSNCKKEKEKIYFSEVETKAFSGWEKAQIDYAKRTYPKNKGLALKWKDKSDNSNKK